MKTYVIGDIHGNYKAFMQCIQRSGFNSSEDTLISLGDIVDRYPESARCVEFCRTIHNFVWVAGNHDNYFKRWLESNFSVEDPVWIVEGGDTTIHSYFDETEGEYDYELLNKHREFAEVMVPYHIDHKNNLFVHGGINWNYPVDKQPNTEIYYWDRDTYWSWANTHEKNGTKFPFRNVFIGHTPTQSLVPVKKANLWNLDQGAGHNGRLTIMDVNTFEYWQSDTFAEGY